MIGHPGMSQLEGVRGIRRSRRSQEAKDAQEAEENQEAQSGRVICHHSAIWTWAFLEAQEVIVFQPQQSTVEPLKQRPSLKME